MNLTQLQILKDEMLDPLGRGYSSMSDLEIANDMNTEYRDLNLYLLTASQVFNAIDKSEYDALSEGDKDMVWRILHMGEVNPFGLEADIFLEIFGGASQTITDLKIIRKATQSRASEIGLPVVHAFEVAFAKSM